ncbi:MAG: CBS domain-containing protein [Methanophagales archaeon]|nr:CBS domain-containing protein [Methanophagales archaeon]
MDFSKEKRVRDVMTRGVVTVPFDTPVSESAKLLVKEDISSIVVTAPDNEAVGVISEIDLIKVFDKDWDKLTAEEVMSTFVRAIDPEMTIKKAADIMRDLNIHRLLILHKAPGRSYDVPVGILSASDILRARVK